MKNKLSPHQKDIIELLKKHDSYIRKSVYFNHNLVVSRTKIPGFDFDNYCLMQFNRATFDVLLRKNVIVQSSEHKDIFNLNPDFV